MRVDDILACAPRVLTQAQRESYFANGYLLLESFIPADWLDRLRAQTARFVELSRDVPASDDCFDLAPSHAAAAPRMRRLKNPDDRDPEFWAFANDRIADAVADLVGPDVLFHHSKLNFKWNDGADDVKWHQDAGFYPHTNYSALAVGTYLQDTAMADGPLAVIPGSHNGPLYEQYDDQDQWTGCLSDADVAGLDQSKTVYLEGPAGSITVHNCRTVHGSPASTADDGRPLLLNGYTSADAFPYMPNPSGSSHARTVVRGKPSRWAEHDPRPGLIPPDWSGGYTSIFAAQSGEDAQQAAE